ncbi:MAG: TetR/AcrR family transcriptional regulator [Microvirgula sp.]|uniref:TetR/AcrR family transcriptional regulator n=2 Tax=Microvirgula aerodenitrificans TaxID=57480 RepID=A0A2S0PB21_9NEIS|nr:MULTISPECIES: TetR/AcrR family transcriptional regulator [Microvirgula]AVY94556.1 TetR/AcrR family transcriptional regulator [Microvirgula aerodenitrificans]RAS19008.1 TetR family transcriptional regulator [Microvirgula sp. AG722]
MAGKEMHAAGSPCCADSRREQVIKAAADCFRQHGFHGAGMAGIAREAGMSVGHIYHYFANKEAIIAAIVQRDLADMLEKIAAFEAAEDVFRHLLDCVDEGVEMSIDPYEAGLWLEILSEASRNPKVSAMVSEADAIVRARFRNMLRNALQTGWVQDERELNGRVEIISAIFDGLIIRSVRNDDFDKEAIMRSLKMVMQYLLSA